MIRTCSPPDLFRRAGIFDFGSASCVEYYRQIEGWAGEVAGVQKASQGGIAAAAAKVLKALPIFAKCLIAFKKGTERLGEPVCRNPGADSAAEAFGGTESTAKENLKCFLLDTIYSC